MLRFYCLKPRDLETAAEVCDAVEWKESLTGIYRFDQHRWETGTCRGNRYLRSTSTFVLRDALRMGRPYIVLSSWIRLVSRAHCVDRFRTSKTSPRGEAHKRNHEYRARTAVRRVVDRVSERRHAAYMPDVLGRNAACGGDGYVACGGHGYMQYSLVGCDPAFIHCRVQ
jgi:hypothetical protein